MLEQGGGCLIVKKDLNPETSSSDPEGFNGNQDDDFEYFLLSNLYRYVD